MTAAELKASILDLAIRGRLVAQDPNDESASDLLARIAAEKAKLIKEKKIKKEKPLAPIDESEVPFPLPEGWAWCRLGDLGSVMGGLWTGTVGPFVRIGVIRAANFTKDCKLDFSKMVYIDVEKKKLEKRVLETGDIIIEKSGGGENQPVGRVVHFGEVEEKYSFCNFTTLFRMADKDELDSRYLHLSLYWSYIAGRTIPMQSNTTNLRNLDMEMYLNQIIPIPPLAEQKRIVAKMEELMPLVERYEKAEAKRIELEKSLPGDLEKSILQEAIRGELVEQDPNDESASELLKRIAVEKAKLIKERKTKKEKPIEPIADDEKPYSAPSEWVWCRMEDLGLFCGGHTPSMADRTLWGNEYLWISSKDMKSKYIVDTGDKLSERGVSELHLLPVDTMVFTTRSGILKHTFPVAILKKEATINQDQRALSLYLPEMVEFLYIVMKGLESHIIHKLTKRGTTVQSVLWDDFLKMPIALPPLTEQKRIVAKVDELLGTIRRLRSA